MNEIIQKKPNITFIHNRKKKIVNEICLLFVNNEKKKKFILRRHGNHQHFRHLISLKILLIFFQVIH